MNRKLKNTLAILGLLVFILLSGGSYLFFFQNSEINEKEDKLKELKSNDYNTEQLTQQLQDLLSKASVLDSILASRKFNIPQNLSSIKFYDFVTDISSGFNYETKADVEYVGQKQDKEFFYYEYKIVGSGDYNDLYRLIHAIELSKELKKVKSVNISNLITTDDEGIPHYIVNYNLIAHVYYSSDNRFATTRLVENDLRSRRIYNSFYPLIRNEIPPNIDGLLEVQGSKLLAIIPEGAFIADSRGNTYLLWEGEQVYLGYLTKIDYDNNLVSFILNKGGVIERVDLFLEKEEISRNNNERKKK